MILAILWMLSMVGLAACGGSGSSGFDAVAENAVIVRVLEQGACAASDGLTLCPAALAAAPAVPAPNGAGIGIDLGPENAIACGQGSEESACPLVVRVLPQGFAAGTVFVVAVRTVDPLSDWTIGTPAAPPLAGAAPSFDAPVELALPPESAEPPGGTTIQIAVLVFERPPGELPARVHELARTGAALVFVTPAVAVAAAG